MKYVSLDNALLLSILLPVTSFSVVEQTLSVMETDEPGSIDVCLTLVSPPVSSLRTRIGINVEGEMDMV